MKRGTTICSKHDEIESLADQIISFVRDAKEDGQSMEDALDKKNSLIKELEEKNSELENKIEKLEHELDYLQRQTA